MERDVYRRIIDLVTEAAELARAVGIRNLLQPGLVKEMIIADALGHDLIPSKRHADARDRANPTLVFEYLSCVEGGTGQIDRLFREPPEKREQSLERIRRNHRIYIAVFRADNQLALKVIYELEPAIVLEEAERQLLKSRNVISHVYFSEKWARRHGAVVYPANPPPA